MITDSVAVGQACADALAGVAVVERVGEHDGALIDGVAGLLIHVDFTLAVGIERFVRIASAYPLVPILIVAANAELDIAIELMKHGAEDLVRLPLDAPLLCRKIERLLTGGSGTVLDAAVLAALRTSDAPGANRRRVFRARVRPDAPATVLVSYRGRHVPAAVLDLSVAHEAIPGGMGLSFDVTTAQTLPLARWRAGRPMELSLSLSGWEETIPLQATLAGNPRRGPKGTLIVGVQYEVRRPDDVRVIQRFWVECQRAPKLAVVGTQGEAKAGRPVRA